MNEELFYSEQAKVPGFDGQAQEKLKNAKVFILGLGGLGSSVLVQLGQCGVGNIFLCDSDTVSLQEVQRQTLYTVDDVNSWKSDAAKKRMQALNPFIQLTSLPFEYSIEKATGLIEGMDLVVDCADNLASKNLLHDSCRKMKIPLLQGSVCGFEGQFQFYLPESPCCMHCQWPKIPENHSLDHRLQRGVCPVTPSAMGSFMAIEACKHLLSIGPHLGNRMILFDFLSLRQTQFKRVGSVSCSFCSFLQSKDESERPTSEYHHFTSREWEVDLHLCRGSRLDEFQVVDIRESRQQELSFAEQINVIRLPAHSLEDLAALESDLAKRKKYLLVCQRGRKSWEFVQELRELGKDNFFSLSGGVSVLEKFWLSP